MPSQLQKHEGEDESVSTVGVVQAVQANSSIRSQAVSLAAPLARLVEDGASKLAQRATGVSALLACCYLAAASHEADEVFKQHKVTFACALLSAADSLHQSWYASHDQCLKLNLSAELGEFSGFVCAYKSVTSKYVGRHVGVSHACQKSCITPVKPD